MFKLCIVVFLALGLIAPAAGFAAQETGFLNRTVKAGGKVYRYQVYVPAEWNRSAKWPVVLFLHGAGERGDDGLVQTQVGIATAIRLRRDRFPCIVVMPQCSKSVWWIEPAMEAQAMAALEQSMKEFKGDPDRVYLTGLSMGGYGTWALAQNYPGRFAALAPICGGIRLPERAGFPRNPNQGDEIYDAAAKGVGATPVWIFHGGSDSVVPPSESRKMNAALQRAGGNVKYTEYEGVGHNSWDRAYAETEFMPWLLSRKLTRTRR